MGYLDGGWCYTMADAARRQLATQYFNEWRDCIHARARVVHLIDGEPAEKYPGVYALLRYYNLKSRRLWQSFRRAYIRAMPVELAPAPVSG